MGVPGGSLAVGAWYASGYDADYDEVNVGAGYEIELAEHVSAALGYTHLNFRTDDADDHEVSVDLAYTGFGDSILVAGAYYSLEADGFFSEVGVQTDLPAPEGMTLSPYALLGINQGYVVDGHDGANHALFGVEASMDLTATLSLILYGAYSIAIDKDADRYPDDAALDDILYGGIGLSAGF
jgi:hypothetical protein